MHSPIVALESLVAIARGRGRSAYRCPPLVPAGYEPVPLVFRGLDAVPVVGVVTRLWRTIVDPVGLLHDAAKEHGGDTPFTIRIPTRFDLSYLPGRRGYDTVLSLPANHAAMGEVFGNVPVIGFWFPRHGTIGDPHELQDLVLTGKRVMAKMLSPQRVSGLNSLVEEVMTQRMRTWATGGVDMAEVLYPAVFEASVRFFAGDSFWRRYGAELLPHLRSIAGAIDIPRAALSVTPAKYLMHEYHHSRRLAKLLRRAAREMPDSPLFAAIRAADVHPDSVAWMAMYVLWNATAYPGSYTLYTLADLANDPHTRAALEVSDDRTELLSWAYWETVRLNPISSLVRHLRAPLTYEHAGRRYWLPAGSIVGVSPGLLNRDPDTWDRPDEYLPQRFSTGANPRTALFGVGPFGCPAAEYSRVLITSVCDAVLRERDIAFHDPNPDRRCRVHLTYPSAPVMAELPVRSRVREAVLASA